MHYFIGNFRCLHSDHGRALSNRKSNLIITFEKFRFCGKSEYLSADSSRALIAAKKLNLTGTMFEFKFLCFCISCVQKLKKIKVRAVDFTIYYCHFFYILIEIPV